jgi:hypothetical protein
MVFIGGMKSSCPSLLLCNTCFMHLAENFMVGAFSGSRKNGFAYYPVLCCLHLCDVLILLGIWEALPCVEWSDAFLSCC